MLFNERVKISRSNGKHFPHCTSKLFSVSYVVADRTAYGAAARKIGYVRFAIVLSAFTICPRPLSQKESVKRSRAQAHRYSFLTFFLFRAIFRATHARAFVKCWKKNIIFSRRVFARVEMISYC